MTNIKLVNYDLLKDVHVRWNFISDKAPNKQVKGISFNYIGKWNCEHPEDLYQIQDKSPSGLTAYFTLGINRWNGNEYVQLMVERITSEDF